MNISPLPDIVYVRMEEPKAGALDTSGRGAVEYAEVIAVGENVTGLKAGDKLFIKSWALDSVYHNNERYNFVNINSGGILAIVNNDS